MVKLDVTIAERRRDRLLHNHLSTNIYECMHKDSDYDQDVFLFSFHFSAFPFMIWMNWIMWRGAAVSENFTQLLNKRRVKRSQELILSPESVCDRFSNPIASNKTFFSPNDGNENYLPQADCILILEGTCSVCLSGCACERACVNRQCRSTIMIKVSR